MFLPARAGFEVVRIKCIKTTGREAEMFGGLVRRQRLLAEGCQHMADKGGRVTMDELLVIFKDRGYPPRLAAPSAFSSGLATLALLKG